METTTINLSWLCLVIPTVLIIMIAVLSTRSRLRYAKRIHEAQIKGAFADLNLPEAKHKFRRLASLGLIGLSGMIISITILLIQLSGNILMPLKGIVIITGCVFGIIASMAGILMKREVDRRLK